MVLLWVECRVLRVLPNIIVVGMVITIFNRLFISVFDKTVTNI